MKQANTHKRLIREHLLNGGSITALEALREYGCYRLASRISDLRQEGMNIKKIMEESICKATGKPVRFARYSLDKENAMPKALRGQNK
jgi:hypothetical protein